MDNYPIIILILNAITQLITASVVNKQFRKAYIYLKRKKYRIDKWVIWNVTWSIAGFVLYMYIVNGWLKLI